MRGRKIRTIPNRDLKEKKTAFSCRVALSLVIIVESPHCVKESQFLSVTCNKDSTASTDKKVTTTTEN